MKKPQKIISIVILLSFVYVALNGVLHTPHDHAHDDECSVYVLEQLFGAMDAAVVSSVLFHFTPYIFLLFVFVISTQRVEKHFAIRAPPGV